MTKTQKNEVVKKDEGTSVAVHDYSQYAGQGFESHTREDYAVPFLGILQSNSPQVETNASARAGMLVNTVTKDTYDGKEGLVFIPALTQHNVIEWKPRTLGGGFVAIHELDSDFIKKVKEEQEFGKWKSVKGNENSNDLNETFNVYGILLKGDGSSEQMIISFGSTKIKIYKRWMTRARTIQLALPDGRRINPPLFAHKYRITTVSEKNSKGSFFNFNIEFDGGNAEKARLGTSDALFQDAVSFADLIKSGSIKVAYDTQAEAAGTEPAEEAEIPFA